MRVLNGATMGNGAAGQITGPVRGATFDSCDFMGNIATNGGACESCHVMSCWFGEGRTAPF